MNSQRVCCRDKVVSVVSQRSVRDKMNEGVCDGENKTTSVSTRTEKTRRAVSVCS